MFKKLSLFIDNFIILISCVTILCVCFGIAHHIKKERNFIKTYSKEFNQNFGEFIEKFDNAFNKGSKSSNNNFNFLSSSSVILFSSSLNSIAVDS